MLFCQDLNSLLGINILSQCFKQLYFLEDSVMNRKAYCVHCENIEKQKLHDIMLTYTQRLLKHV